MQLFIEQCLEETPEPEDRINATELYEVYQGWYRKYVSPKSIPSMHLFGRQLSSKVERRKVGGHTYDYGVQLSEEGERFRPSGKSV